MLSEMFLRYFVGKPMVLSNDNLYYIRDSFTSVGLSSGMHCTWGAIQLHKKHHEKDHENHHEKTSHQKVTIKKSNWTFVMIFVMIFFQLNWAPVFYLFTQVMNLD